MLLYVAKPQAMHLTLFGAFAGKDLKVLTADLKKIHVSADNPGSIQPGASFSITSVSFVYSHIEGDVRIVGFMTYLNTMNGYGKSSNPNCLNAALLKASQKVDEVLKRRLRVKPELVRIHLSAF